MSTEPEAPAIPDPIELGDGRTVIFDEPTSGFYRVRMPNGEVQAFPAKAEATPENAIDDIVDNPPAPTEEQLVADFAAWAVVDTQAMLDQHAQAHGYDNVLSARSYAGFANAFQAEGQAYVAWSGAVWANCYAKLGSRQPAAPIPAKDSATWRASLPAYEAPSP